MRIWLALMLLGGVAIWGGSVFSENRQREKAEALAAAKAVAVVPPANAEAWHAYIHDGLTSQIRSAGSGRLAIANPWSGGTTLVEARPRYIECDPVMGVIIRFGSGEMAPEVVVGGILRHDARKPDLGVHGESLASKNLHEETCRLVDDWLNRQAE